MDTLRDWALEVAKDEHDVGFYWEVAKHLPSTQDANLDWAAYDPIDAIREIGHLVRHFREEAADPEVADMLRIRYVDYLVEHADDRGSTDGLALVTRRLAEPPPQRGWPPST